MEPFTIHTAVAAPLMRDNVDTDAIIPSREMRSVSRKGLADGLFAGWRYTEIGSRIPNPDFVLNDPRYQKAGILVSGANFGCGSSREHAVWALREYGIRAVIAPSFNPIFRGNCIANGVLPVALPAHDVAAIADIIGTTAELTINLETQQVLASSGQIWSFDIDPEARAALLAGLDPIGQTLQLADQIAQFRAADQAARPWLYAPLGQESA